MRFGDFRESEFYVNEDIIEKIDGITIRRNKSVEEILVELLNKSFESGD